MSTLKNPFDLVRLSIDENVLVKCKGGRELLGRLHAFDEHMNLVLGDVTETITVVDIDPNTKQETKKVDKRSLPMLLVRGDAVILLSPPVRTS